MANFEFDIPVDFLQQLGSLADIDRIAPKMLEAAAPILQKELKSELEKHKDTGALQKSIKITKVKANNYGYFLKVKPTGNYNNAKLIWLEYGTSKMVAKPTIQKAVNNCMDTILDKMQEVFNKESEM